MKLLATIREKDIDPGRENLPDDAHLKYRKAAKVVLFDGDGNIALNHYPPHEGYLEDEYYMPGGGVDEGETIIEALHREALEETGCKIKNIKELGQVTFYMTERGKIDSYAYVAEVDGKKGEPQLTEKEKSNNLQVVWKTIDEAIKLVEQNQSRNHARVNALIILNEVKNNLSAYS